MKKITFALLSIAFLTACMKDHNADMKMLLNITHPAIYVVNGEGNSLSVIDLTDNTVKHDILLGEAGVDHSKMSAASFMYPHHISLNKLKTKLVIGVPNMDLSLGHSAQPHGGKEKGNIVVVDARTGETLKVLELTKPCHNAIFSPDDKEIWASQMEMEGKILVYDAQTYTLKNTVKVGKMPAEVTFSYDGKIAFVTNGHDNTVSAIDASTKVMLKTISVGKNPVGAWTGVDNKNYCDNEDGKTVSVINANTLNVENTIDLGFTPDYVAFLPTLQEVWVTGGKEGKVSFFKLNNGNYTKTGEVVTGAGAHAIQFSQDYKTAYVTNQKANSVTILNVDTKTKLKDLTVGTKPNGITARF